MPIYVYRCNFCGLKFEKEATKQEFEKGKLPKCKNCGSKDVKKIITPVSVVFKGDGFTLSKGEGQ